MFRAEEKIMQELRRSGEKLISVLLRIIKQALSS
jgi:hypothetical protein